MPSSAVWQLIRLKVASQTGLLPVAGVGVIIGAACRKIVPKDGRVFKTSAFKVSCDSKYADLFYNEANWPVGCELRDWYVKRYDSNVAN